MIDGTQGQDTVITPPKNHKRWRYLAAAVVAGVALTVALPSIALWHSGGKRVSLDSVQTTEVFRGDLIRDIAVSGRLIAANAPQLYSSEPGVITLLAKPGDSVEFGQSVATIASPELDAQLQQAQSELDKLTIDASRGRLANNEAQLDLERALDTAKLNLTAAQREQERTDISYKKQVISEQEWAQNQDKLLAAQVQYKHALRKVDVAKERLAFEQKTREMAIARQQLALDELTRRKQATEIKAPVSGVIGNWLVAQKDNVPDSTPLMTVVDLSRYEAEIGVPEFYAEDLGLGLTVSMTISGEKIVGEVIAISPEIQASEVMIRVSVPASESLRLRQNQRVTARLEFEKKPDVLMVRRGSFLTSSKQQQVYRLDEQQLASQQPVDFGATSVNYIEIVSGLNEGDQIISSSYEDFVDTAQIKLID